MKISYLLLALAAFISINLLPCDIQREALELQLVLKYTQVITPGIDYRAWVFKTLEIEPNKAPIHNFDLNGPHLVNNSHDQLSRKFDPKLFDADSVSFEMACVIIDKINKAREDLLRPE